MAIWLDDPVGGRSVRGNPALDALWDLDAGAGPLEERLIERVHPDDRPRFAARWASTGSDYDLAHRILWRDGCLHWVRSRALPIRDDAGGLRLRVCLCEPAAAPEHDAAEPLLLRLLRAERRAALAALSARLAHDVRHHLHGLTLASGVVEELIADLVQAGPGGRDQAQAAICREVPEQTRGIAATLARLGSLVDALRQPERVLEPHPPQVFDAGGCVERITRCIEPCLRGRGADVRLRLAGAARVQRGWATLVEQAVLNLLTNAAAALDRPGCLVEVSLTGDPATWTITVADGGAGMPEALRATLGHRSCAPGPDGSGVGWSIIARCMRRHDGHWLITAPVGGGTRVDLVFPTTMAL